MFACRDAIELMTEEREGTLRGSQGLWYRLHMRICPYCRTCRRQMDEVVALAKETRRGAPASEVEASVLAALRARSSGKER
jgi:hypothetical protein